MPGSTSSPQGPLIAGSTVLPGLQVSPYGGQISSIKIYGFSITDTGQIGTTSTEKTYTVSGLSTNDVPLMLSLSTGSVSGKSGAINLRVSAANTLAVTWGTVGSSTADTIAATGQTAMATLWTGQYFTQSSSTTT